jgi:uncharacterized protein YceK
VFLDDGKYFGPYSGSKGDLGVCGNIFDLPLSFGLDTALLPISIPWAQFRESQPHPR